MLTSRRTTRQKHRPRPPGRGRPQLPSPGALHREPAGEGLRGVAPRAPTSPGSAGLSRLAVWLFSGWRWGRGGRGASARHPFGGVSHRLPGAFFFCVWCARVLAW